MKYPQLWYAENPSYPDLIALSASFVPTFELEAPREELEVLDEEEPESTNLSDGKDFVFIFIVDRSGSMGGERITTAKEALKLFMKSLPVRSHFSIISFGSKHAYM